MLKLGRYPPQKIQSSHLKRDAKSQTRYVKGVWIGPQGGASPYKHLLSTSLGTFYISPHAVLEIKKVRVHTWPAINQKSLSTIENLCVASKLVLCHTTGFPVILKPSQLCVHLININSRAWVPWNDSDFVLCAINHFQTFLALLKAYRIC